MGSRDFRCALAALALALALASTSAASAQPRAPQTSAAPRPRSGERERQPALAQARADLGADERALLELRDEMRRLRIERREAMQRARDSGDPHAIERVQEEFRPRMEALRGQVRQSRDAVMERRLQDHPELAARLAARGESGDRFECGGGPGHASDEARRRAFRRLQALAARGSVALADPADIPTPVRQELQLHARRIALLQCIRDRAGAKGDTEAVERSRLLYREEQQRHDRSLRELFGAPGGARAGGRPAAAHTRTATTTTSDDTTAPTEGAEETER